MHPGKGDGFISKFATTYKQKIFDFTANMDDIRLKFKNIVDGKKFLN